jgi:hypothetical protein
VNCPAINWPGAVLVVLSRHGAIGMAEHVGYLFQRHASG